MAEYEIVIDCFPKAALRYGPGWTVVAIDVIRATTTLITASRQRRRCIPAPSLESAYAVAGSLQDPLLAGELGGEKPARFELANSPAAMACRTDIQRPMVLVTSSGTPLICNAAHSDEVYLACFRNSRAVARHLTKTAPRRIAVLGAGTRDEFRDEDQICCAWVAGELIQAGYAPGDDNTAGMVNRWKRARPADCLQSKSVHYLRRSGQLADLHFILARHNDLDAVFRMEDGEVVMLQEERFEGAA